MKLQMNSFLHHHHSQLRNWLILLFRQLLPEVGQRPGATGSLPTEKAIPPLGRGRAAIVCCKSAANLRQLSSASR